MKVQFVTREPDVCQLIASYLSDESITCAVKDNFLDFYLAFEAEKVQCDLLVLDFRQFQHLLFSVGDFLKRLKQPVPFIFYNDPYPDEKGRVAYWIHQNENLYESAEFHQLAPILQRLNAVIEDPSVHPHISLLQPPLPIFCAENTEPPSFDLAQFRLRTKIPPALFCLLEYFYGNICKEVSIKDISKEMFGAGFCNPMKRNAVYSYVSRLKKYIKSDPQAGVDIIRSSSGRYKMVSRSATCA